MTVDVGSRVQVPAWTGRWKRGDRFGTVVARRVAGGGPVMRGTWFVRVDRSGQLVGFGVDSLREVHTD